jgi:glutathione S-transferase
MSSASGPNPWKVAIVLEELGIPYEPEYMDMADLKKPPYEKINPNGRVPAIHDPNTNITLWESAAIVEYLADTYDKEHKLSVSTFPEKYYVKQWIAFQISGQGPYFGQAAWFGRFHHEKLPSAIKRYQDQVTRVFYVLNLALEGKEYLLGDKCTVADLMFIPWDQMSPFFFGDEFEGMEIPKKYPAYWAWKQRLLERPAVKKVLAEKQAQMAKGH